MSIKRLLFKNALFLSSFFPLLFPYVVKSKNGIFFSFLSLPSACWRAKLLRTEITGRRRRRASKLKLFFWCFLELPLGMYTYLWCSFWRIFWQLFLTNFLTFFFDKYFDESFNEIFRRIFWPIFWQFCLTNFWIFLTNFFDKFFWRFFLTNFLMHKMRTLCIMWISSSFLQLFDKLQ